MVSLKDHDPELYQSIANELFRQQNTIELIASENFVSKHVLEAQGSVLTNKYAEGYPNRRYYGGCEYVDVAESLAIARAKALFNVDHANVQPHSGSQANMAVYMSVLQPGDTMLGMSLSHGGHLTHGSPVNFSGTLYNIVSYGVDIETGYIDYEQVRSMAHEHKPKVILAGASAYPRTIDFERFAQIAAEIDAYFVVDMAHIAGLVAAGQHPSPAPYADFITTTTHKTLRGPRGGMILCKKQFAKAVDKTIFPGIQGGPLMHVIAAKAVALAEASTPEFVTYIKRVVTNAHALAEALMARGFNLVSGGTDTHLMLVDLRNKGTTGKLAEHVLDAVNITCNKNTVPNETESPFITSGIRLGTPAMTTRGMDKEEMYIIAEMIDAVITNHECETTKEQVKGKVKALCAKFPLY